jgi:hypothetical protein
VEALARLRAIAGTIRNVEWTAQKRFGSESMPGPTPRIDLKRRAGRAAQYRIEFRRETVLSSRRPMRRKRTPSPTTRARGRTIRKEAKTTSPYQKRKGTK